jgi:DNA-binding NtrC family response regulator
MRILLVDVEQRFAAAVRQGLEAEGLAVDVAHDGDEGLWMAQSNDYDAIVRSTRSWRRPLASERVTAPGDPRSPGP